jgi:hypothetical protein
LRSHFLAVARIFLRKVFNTFVEKAVEKPGSVDVNGSLTAALAFCTGVVAGTLVVAVEEEDRFRFRTAL